MATSPMVGGADPAILKSLETQTPSVARTSPATVNASTGVATSSGSSVSRGIVPQVSGGTVTYNQATQATAGNSVTVTSSTSNDPGDVVTIYTSPKAVSVSSVNQTVNTYKVNNYTGNEYTDSNVANYLPTFTGNVGAGNVNVTGTVYTSGISSTGSASLTILNVSTIANLGAVGNITITGGSNGQVLTTNGSGNLSWTTVSGGNSSYGNTDVANYLPTFTGNIGANVVTANLFVGSGANLTNIAGANVGGFVPNANVANTAFAVAAANVSGLGNIATINLDGNVSNVLAGNGTWIAAGGGGGGAAISNGTSNVSVVAADGNVVIGVNNDAANWTFATDGNIYSQPDTDLILVVVDTNEDGYAVKQSVTDGTTELSRTSLEVGQFSIYTNLDGAAEEWRFNGNTLQVSTNSTVRGFDSNVVVQAMFAGTSGKASLQSVSNSNDPNIFTTIDATTTGANISVYNGGSNSGVGYTWQFANDGRLTFPGTPRIDTDANNFEVQAAEAISLEANTVVNIYTDAGNTTYQWQFGDDGNLTLPGGLIGPASANFTIYSNAGQHNFTFADDGTFYAPDNVVLGGNTIYIGPGANTLTGLAQAVMIASSNHSAYIQAVINNVSDNGSADWVAQGRLGDDNGGWADFGFTSGGFNDANYTITGPGDGYLFVESYAPGQLITGPKGGNLILATGEQGTVRDIIFGTGGFLTGNIFGRISHANNSLELSRTGATITFPDATEQNTAWTGSVATVANGNSNVRVATSDGNVTITSSGTNSWTFDTTGNLTLPANTFAVNYANGTQVYLGGGSNIANGNSNVSIATANGNVTISAVGNTTMTVTGTGANVTGTLTSTGKIGYASGSSVTQLTSRGTGVTINTLAGTIITTSVAMVANEIDTFSVINSSVDPSTDIVLAQIVSPNQGTYNCIANPALIGGFSNGFFLNIVNISGFTTSDETITIRFMVIKAPNA